MSSELKEILFKKYGKCEIPKGCYLFRKAIDNAIYPTMFFGFDPFVTYSSKQKSSETQVWKVRQNITSLFPIKEVLPNNWHISSIGDLCIEHLAVPQEDSDYLNIKHSDSTIRRSLISFLRQNQIYSWVADCEGRVGMELFIFHDIDKIGACLEYVGPLKKDDPKNQELNYYPQVKIIHDPSKRSK